ncbi:adenosylcobinamide-GDP ribazoletransferase [Desulfogranum mediterraneum]|uniref:adenosylcobinamide-GDP ribazoletransferase n=1 Tax=Desulfogranum mediterraneum TaxID=160661 RepID=UPI00048F7DAD|nr:adenosylcobinamide-GDP ribazoletransferase [Desulfogranum mediterraneum]
MSSLVLMIQFLTRYPIPLEIEFTAEHFVAGMRWMPLVGLLVGLPAALMLSLAEPLFGHGLATLLALVVLITVTGGLHLDGIGDTADGLFCYRPRERVLEIMRDSTLGTNGVVAVVMTILIKLVALNSLPLGGALAALLAAPVLGRTSTTWHAAFVGYAREQSGMGAFVSRVGLSQALPATLMSLVLVLMLLLAAGLGWQLVLLLTLLGHGATIIVAVGFGRYLHHRIGGITGDTIGATIELTEMITFLLFLFAWKHLI